MRYVRYALLVVAVVGLVGSLGYIVYTPPASPTPEVFATLVAERFDGTEMSFKEFAGDILIIDFWATWCAPCITEIPHYNALDNDYRDNGVTLLGLTVESGTAEAQQTPVLDSGRTGPLAGPAAEAVFKVALEAARNGHPTLSSRPHERNPAPRSLHLGARELVGRAGRQAEPTADTPIDSLQDVELGERAGTATAGSRSIRHPPRTECPTLH